MYALDDRLRSIRRMIAVGMEKVERYDLHTQRMQVADDARPAGLVEPSTVAIALGNPRTTVVAGDVQKQQTFAVILYVDFDETEDPRASRLRAHQHAQRLDDIVTLGLVSDDDPPVSICAPFTVPLYDYEGVPISGPDRAGPADPYAFAEVTAWTVQPVQDPLDDRRWSVAGSMRVTWWDAGRDDDVNALPTESMPGAWQSPG